MPERSRRCFIHAGVGAFGSMPSIRRATKRGQACSSITRTARVPLYVTGVGGTTGRCNGAPVIAATSRAMPASDRQSARLGVSFSVISVSSRVSASRNEVPGASDESSASRPLASSSIPNSFAEHSMPRDSMPRTVVRLISSPPGNVAPSSAQGTIIPAAALGAPQTICNFSFPPASTMQTRNRSASGCGVTASILATTTCANGGAAGAIASTSRPDIVSLSHNASVDSGGSHSVRSQSSENFIVAAVVRELT